MRGVLGHIVRQNFFEGVKNFCGLLKLEPRDEHAIKLRARLQTFEQSFQKFVALVRRIPEATDKQVAFVIVAVFDIK